MNKLVRFALLTFAFVLGGTAFGQNNLPAVTTCPNQGPWRSCVFVDSNRGDTGQSAWVIANENGSAIGLIQYGKLGPKYLGEVAKSTAYGGFRGLVANGIGVMYYPNGTTVEGRWLNGSFQLSEAIPLPLIFQFVEKVNRINSADWMPNTLAINTRITNNNLLDSVGRGESSNATATRNLIASGYTFCPSTNKYYFGDSNLCPEHAAGDISAASRNAQNALQIATQAQLEEERRKLADERFKLEVEKTQREQAKRASRISIQASATKPDVDGDFVIYIQTSADTASLKVDDEEQGANKAGFYTVRRVARVGITSAISISAKDIYGNTDTKTINVARQAVDSRPTFARLNPANIKPQPARDAVAIIIGIQNYKLIPKAEYANQDAQDFYDYASRALGIKQENIKLLLDDEADVSGILTAFQNWLPLKVRKGKTDVYVFYSGHGLPSPDGKSLFFLPVGANKDFVAKTAISQQEIVAGLKAAQPKSVTMFIDSCYSGQIRTGETLLASARPVVMKVDEAAYPPEFTVITASASDQIASSSPDLKHGIFSYYLMKGLEGEADENRDGTITVGKLQSYLAERVPRFAMTMSRKQEPQFVGDSTRVLVSK